MFAPFLAGHLAFLLLCWIRPFPPEWKQPAQLVNRVSQVTFWVTAPFFAAFWIYFTGHFLLAWF